MEKCDVCGATEHLRRFALTIDGEPLRMQPLLCIDHGDKLTLRVGAVIGSLCAPIEEVFVSWRRPE